MIINNKPKKVKYKCKENDALINFYLEYGKIDEVHIKIKGEVAWTVIGYKDLKKGIKKAKKQSHDNKSQTL